MESEDFEERLKLFQKYLDETPKEQLDADLAEIHKMSINGPTVEEYFQGINPEFQYQKGYSEGAKKFKEMLTFKLSEKNDDQVMIPISEVLKLIQKTYDEE